MDPVQDKIVLLLTNGMTVESAEAFASQLPGMDLDQARRAVAGARKRIIVAADYARDERRRRHCRLGYFQDLGAILLVKNVARHNYSGQDKEIRIINQAMAGSKALKVHYHSASQGRDIETLFHPYGMVFFGASLYYIGFMPLYGEICTLKVDCFKGVEMAAQRFERPADFSLAAHIQGGFGIFSSGKPRTIKVRFTGWASTNIREHQWHPRPKIVKEGVVLPGHERTARRARKKYTQADLIRR